VIGRPVGASWKRRQLPVWSEKGQDRQHCRRRTGRSVEHGAWKRCCTWPGCTCVASSRAIPCARLSAALRAWLGSERARWPVLSERLSAAAGAGRKAAALLSWRPLSRAVWPWQRRR